MLEMQFSGFAPLMILLVRLIQFRLRNMADRSKILKHSIIWLVIGLAGTCWLLSGCAPFVCRHRSQLCAKATSGYNAVGYTLAGEYHAQGFHYEKDGSICWLRYYNGRVEHGVEQELRDTYAVYTIKEMAAKIKKWDRNLN